MSVRARACVRSRMRAEMLLLQLLDETGVRIKHATLRAFIGAALPRGFACCSAVRHVATVRCAQRIAAQSCAALLRASQRCAWQHYALRRNATSLQRCAVHCNAVRCSAALCVAGEDRDLTDPQNTSVSQLWVQVPVRTR